MTPAGGSAPHRLSLLAAWPPRLTAAAAVLIAVNVAVFLAMLGFGAGLWHSSSEVQVAWGANFGPATKDGQWWRLASAMFLHFGVLHLAMNMLALWDCGSLVERLFGPLRFLVIYLGSGLAGNLVSLVSQADRAVSGGASGAIFGVFGALLVRLAVERERVEPSEFRWLFYGGAAFAAATLVLGFFIAAVDEAAHIGGLVGGMLLGAALARPLPPLAGVPGRLRAATAALFLAAMLLIVSRVPPPLYRFGEEQQARTAIGRFLGDERRIDDRWRAIVSAGQAGTASFDELAADIDSGISKEYLDSFEQLSSVNVSPTAPSAANLDVLRHYAQLRGDAAHALAEALRGQDRDGVRRALEAMRRAPETARSASGADRLASTPSVARKASKGAAPAAAPRASGRVDR